MASDEQPVNDPAANLLSFTKNAANEQLIRQLNGMTTNALSRYPDAEVQSWPYQKSEAEAVIAAGHLASLDLAPFLTGVCQFQYGDASSADRLVQVIEKAAVVLENANGWLVASQFVNGLRARTQEQIAAASDPATVSSALNAAIAEAEVFRQQAGL